jgi:hypothetical protein
MYFLRVLLGPAGVRKPYRRGHFRPQASGDVCWRRRISCGFAGSWIPLRVVRASGSPRDGGPGEAMTIFDLLFIALFLMAFGTFIDAAGLAFRGQRTRARALPDPSRTHPL